MAVGEIMGFSPRVFYTLSNTAVVNSVILGFCLMRWLLKTNGWLEQYKIQKKEPSAALIQKAWINYVPTVVGAMGVFYMAFPYQPNLDMDLSVFPGIVEVLRMIVVCMLCEETCFYWSHRMLHTNLFYGLIHKQHHTFHQVVPIAFSYSNMIENALNTVGFMSGPFVLGNLFGMRVHIVSVWVWNAFMFWETTEAHGGYDLPFSPLRLLGTAAKHDFHHSHNKGCYGSMFGIWDWAMGTDADFRRFQAGAKVKRAKED